MAPADRIDLHLHTTASDGSLPPEKVVALAEAAGVRALAITDHDTVDGLAEAMAAAARSGIEVIPGIEISARYRPGGPKGEIHILGYFLDWNDAGLLASLARFRAAREARNPLIVEKLQGLGLAITYDEVKALAGHAAIGRPHIARVLMAKNYVQSAKEAFDRYLAEGAAAYVPRTLPEPAEAIAVILAARGVPVLAHPSWLERADQSIYKICERMKTEGLRGVEVHYSTHRPEQAAQYLETARRLDLLVTGGSDFHGVTKPDISVGSGRGTLNVPQKLLEPLRKAAASLCA